ncbi:hypothetical protein FRB95_000498 [Tulasnella sp. JGI-2019a]|nr:hypothetical protein FRB95_000498 [Tulasnella sp. JGI-2019a]
MVHQAMVSARALRSTIKTHSHRWASLEITALEGGEWVKFAGVRAPFLEELNIYMSGEQLDIDRGNFPNVPAMSLTNAGLQDWTCGLLSGLRYLYLFLRHGLVHLPSLQQLLDTLAASPRLERLELEVMDLAVDNASIRCPLILLPELRNIKFRSLPAIAMDVILQSVHATHCSILSLKGKLLSSQQLNISGENFPDVSSLSLTHLGLRDWSSGPLLGLHYLRLSAISAFLPSLQQLLDVLAANPYLEELNLSAIAPTVDDISIRRPPIPFPDLRDLYFKGLPTIVMDVILQSVHAAYCPIIDLTYGSRRRPAQSLFPAISFFVAPSLSRYFATVPAPITLTLWGEGFRFTVDSEKHLKNTRRTFSIAIRGFLIDTNAMIKWVDGLTESKISNPHPPHLTVRLVDKEMVDRVCASKWRLTHVEAVEVREHGTELCQFLSSQIDLGNGGYGWPGPSVRKIVLDDSRKFGADVALEMVRRRITASRGVDRNKLAPLEELVISDRTSIANVPLVEVEAGKEQMTCESLMEAVRRVIVAGTCGITDRDITI